MVQESESRMYSLISNENWPKPTKGQIATLYLLAKSKSFPKGKWLWKPIAAAPRYFLCPYTLRKANRDMTCFVRTILDETLSPILHMSISGIGEWLRDIPRACSIGDRDCKDQDQANLGCESHAGGQ